MRFNTHFVLMRMIWLLLIACGLAMLAGAQATSAQATLQDAIKARTEVVLLQQEVERLDRDIIEMMRKVIAKADGKQIEGNILLTKEKYGDSVLAFQEATRLYRGVIDGRKLFDKLAKAVRDVAALRLLAESVAKPEQMQEAKRLQINAEGYFEAGEIEQALSELQKARQAFERLLPLESPATLEEAVAARTAMLSARDQIKDLPELAAEHKDNAFLKLAIGSATKGPKPGSMADLLSLAQKAESAAGDALAERQYAPARSLFAAAEKLYREAGVLQGKRDTVAALRKSVEDSMKQADEAFKGSARPASFERGKQALADADKLLADDDIDAAKPLLAKAAEHFGAARAGAEQLNALTDARQSWSAALAAADEELLNKHVSGQFQAAKAKAVDAQSKAAAGQTVEAAGLFKAATAAINDAVAAAKTKENTAKAEPVIARLKTAIAGPEKFSAEDVLAELEALIPSDPRVAALRERVAALPGPKKKLTVELGGGVKMEFVLICPGSFMMGSNSGASDEKPVHEVAINKAFYLGKYEVTQEQWQTVMGGNPSGFKGAKNPVDGVSWEDCLDFLAKLQVKLSGMKASLPGEAQWEYACRAGSKGEYCCGDSEAGLGEYAWYDKNSGNTTHPVGEKKPNAWGFYDMHGNVWEWCADWYDGGYYSNSPAQDPTGPSSGAVRVFRGGSWLSFAGICRSAIRIGITPSYRFTNYGFRVALDIQ